MSKFSGGFPQSETVTNRTLNKFHKTFSGCLQDVQINNAQQLQMQEPTNQKQSLKLQQQQLPKINIQDFSRYDGENIGECELYDEFVNNNYFK